MTPSAEAAIALSRVLASCCAKRPESTPDIPDNGSSSRRAALPISLGSIGDAALSSRPGNAMSKAVSEKSAKTLFDKIWDFHRVGQRADGRDLLYIDRHVLHE